MKKLTETLSLRGHFGTLTMSELRARPGDLILQVELGKVFLIMRAGKPVAVISPVPGETLTIEVKPDGKWGYSL